MASCEKDARFVEYTTEQIAENNANQINKNSVKNEEKAVKCFKLFLEQNKVEDSDFFTYSDEVLDLWLAKFYWGARTEKREKYTCSSMTTMRYALNRALQKSGKQFDITKKEYRAFIHSINSFDAAMKDLKKCGKGSVKNTPEITPSRKSKQFFHSNNFNRTLIKILSWNICQIPLIFYHFKQIYTVCKTALFKAKKEPHF